MVHSFVNKTLKVIFVIFFFNNRKSTFFQVVTTVTSNLAMCTSSIGIYAGPVAQRIRRLTTDQEIAGSNPSGIDS